MRDAGRQCGNCGTVTAIRADERLWPATWSCPVCSRGLVSRDGFVQLAADIDVREPGFDTGNFELLAKVEERHFWFKSRNELIKWLVRKWVPNAGRALEVGCGTGFVLYALRDALPTARISGSELHIEGLSFARFRHAGNVELFQMDARNSGLQSALDMIGAFDVLEHIEDDEAVLRELFRMLKPGGHLLVSVPQHPALWSAADDVAHHKRRYRRRELIGKAIRAGFTLKYQSSFVCLAFPMMIVSRLLGRVRGGQRNLQQQHDSEFAISGAANSILLAMNRLEHFLRKMGLPLPFGGSQVLVLARPPEA